MDHEQRRQRQQRSPRGNALGSGGGASSGKNKGGGGKGGGKKPIKVVYISNPMRVKTSAAGFRALVQELTGRDADPSKYSSDELAGVVGAGAEDATAAAEIDCGAALGFSPGGAAASCDTVVASPSPAAADHLHPDDASAVAAPYGGGYDDEEEEEDGFRSPSELLENNYAVFSPPTLLYDHYPHSKELVGRSTDRARAFEALRTEKVRLETQLAAARLAAADGEAGRVAERASLEARTKVAEDSAATAQAEKAALEERLAAAEQAAAAFRSDAEATARAARQEKADLEARAGQAESDLQLARERVTTLEAQVGTIIAERDRQGEIAQKRENEILCVQLFAWSAPTCRNKSRTSRVPQLPASSRMRSWWS